MVRRYGDSTIRQEQIVDAARKLVVKLGSEHVTVKRIAQEVGFSEAAIYRHFKSKKDILSLLADQIKIDLLADIGTSNARGNSPLNTLDDILKNHLSAIERRRGVSFQVVAEIISLGDKKLNKKIFGIINEYIDCLEDILHKGVEVGQVRGDIDLKATAYILFGAIQGVVNTWALSNYSFNPQQKFDPIWDTLCEIIAKR